MREAPSNDIIKYLINEGATVKVYDLVALEKAKDCNNLPLILAIQNAHKNIV